MKHLARRRHFAVLAVIALATLVLPMATAGAMGGDAYADVVVSFTLGGGTPTLDDGDGGSDALGAPNGDSSLPLLWPTHWTGLGTLGSLAVAFEDIVCVPGADAELLIWESGAGDGYQVEVRLAPAAAWTVLGTGPGDTDGTDNISGTAGDNHLAANSFEASGAFDQVRITGTAITDTSATPGPDIDAVQCLHPDQLPEGEITSPDEGEIVFGSLTLGALYYDDNPDGVQWAVREGTCAAGTNTKAGNVDGFSTLYDWVTGNPLSTFSSTIDVSDASYWVPGMYCFIFNPGEGTGEPNMRLTREFYIGALGALSPDVAYNPAGSDHTVSVDIGVSVADVEVLFVVSGANPTSGTGMTSAAGVASFTWTGTYPGTDVVTACIDEDDSDTCDVDEPTATNTATKYWLDFGAIGPSMAYNPMGSNHTVSVDVGVVGIDVLFVVSGANSTSGTGTTDATGVAWFTWTGANPGTDTVTACFDADFNGSCDAGEMFASADATKKWWDVSISGGGQILQADSLNPKNPFKISFGGHLYQLGSGVLECEWQVNFHNVSIASLDKASFHATSCSELNMFDPTVPADGVVNFMAHGTLNGVAGYTILFRMEDRTEPSVLDTIRMELFDGATKIYDTSPTDNSGSDFPNNSNNVGTARTLLDNGNIQIWDLT